MDCGTMRSPSGRGDEDEDEAGTRTTRMGEVELGEVNGECSPVGVVVEGDKEEECRFCFEGGTREDPLVMPCACRGTIATVHKSCLRHWVLEKGCMECEICGDRFVLPAGETILTSEEALAYRHALTMRRARAGHAAGDEEDAMSQRSRNLRNFLLRHERLSRWINACILLAFSVIMVLVIVFLIWNWNSYYKGRGNTVMVNEVQPFDSGIEVFTGFCSAKVKMMCLVPRESLRNSSSLQGRLCHGPEDAGKPCLRYSTYSVHQTCEAEGATCSLMLLPALQDGACDGGGGCARDFPPEILRAQGGKRTFQATLINGACACRP